jgi:hypothetical protein
MTQKDKELLFKDLCARLLYGVKVRTNRGPETIEGLAPFCHNEVKIALNLGWSLSISDYTPYLRPMSSMTEEEKRELQSFYPGCFGGQWLDTEKGTIDIFECSSTITLYLNDSERIVDWLNKNMFDYRGLIEKGLAIEAPREMYNLNK